MRKQITLAILLLLGLTLEAQLSRYNLHFTLSKTDFADTISIRYERGQVIVPVRFADNTYHFLFDTGASQTTVFDDTPIDGMKPVGVTVSHDALSVRDTVRKVSLPPMTLGSVTFSGFQAVIQRRVSQGRHSIDGILGFDLICKGLNAKIDIQRKQLIFSDRPDYFEREPGVTMKYSLDLHVPYVQVSPFGKYCEWALFDTGSRQLYVMNKKSFDKGQKKAKADISSQIEGRSIGRSAISHGGVEQRAEVVFLSLRRLQFGSFAFCDVHTRTTQGGSHLGAKVLEYGSVTFNPKRRQLRYQPYTGQDSAVVSNKQMEKSIVPVDNRPVVGLIWEKSTPYNAGFREGDTIMMIDGKSIPTFADYLRFRPIINQVHIFVVRDAKGNLKKIETVW